MLENQMEFRCVRANLYPTNTPPSAMQGHYLPASSEEEALRRMKAQYPDDIIWVEKWKTRH